MIPKKKLRLQAQAYLFREALHIPKQAFIGQKAISGINQPGNIIKKDTGLCWHLLVRMDAFENYPTYPATFGIAAHAIRFNRPKSKGTIMVDEVLALRETLDATTKTAQAKSP